MDELTQLCDEISQMFPSPNLKDTTTSQFKTFLKKLEESKVDPAQINALKQAYNYFNYLMGDVGVGVSNVAETKSNESKDNESTVADSKDAKTTAESEEKKEDDKKKESDVPDAEMIEILLNLAEASEST